MYSQNIDISPHTVHITIHSPTDPMCRKTPVGVIIIPEPSRKNMF